MTKLMGLLFKRVINLLHGRQFSSQLSNLASLVLNILIIFRCSLSSQFQPEIADVDLGRLTRHGRH